MKLKAIYPVVALVIINSVFALAAISGSKKRVPRFADFPVEEIWQEQSAKVKLTTSEARVFRTRLHAAAKEKANFAGHYHVVRWGCGSNCLAGAVLDLQTGQVYSPPAPTNTGKNNFSFCQSAYEHSGVEHKVDSRLLIIRCGLNFIERQNKNVPDSYYYVWEKERFRLLRHDHEPSDVKTKP